MTQLEYYQKLTNILMIKLEDQFFEKLTFCGMDEFKADQEANERVREICDISLDEYENIADHYYEDAYYLHLDNLAERRKI